MKEIESITLEETLKLERQLCFALYVASKEVIKKYKHHLDAVGLTYTGYITMLALWEQDNVSVKELGTRLYLDSGTLTPLLKKLQLQGYIDRTRDKNNERSVLITLTKNGKNLKKSVSHIPQTLFSSLGSDAKTLGLLLDNVHNLIDALSQSEM